MKSIVLLALITIASAQFSQNFTQILLGWNTQGVRIVPENITDADGTTYFQLQRVDVTQPANQQWTMDLVAPDGSITQHRNVNNDLVAVAPDGSAASVSAQLPPLLGVTGPVLLTAVSNGIESAVTSTYGNPNLNRITTAQANTDADSVVNAIIATSTLPVFFLTPFKAQAYNQISTSLANAQAVSKAINASLVASTPATGSDTGSDSGTDNSTNSTATSVNIPLNLSSFNLASLDNVSEIDAAWGNQGVRVHLVSEAEAVEVGDASWDVDLETVAGSGEDNNEWALSWVDNQGVDWNVYDENGRIVVVGNGETQDWSTEAGWWANAEDGDLDAAVGAAIENFVDAVVANADKASNVAINVGDNGLDWTYPAEAAAANP